MLIHAVGMLCGLGAATLATTVKGRRDMVALGAGFIVATLWLWPQPVWIGGMVAVVAVLGLAVPRLGSPGTLTGNSVRVSVRVLSAGVAGALAGLWVHVLGGYGLPAWSAVPLAAAVPGTALVLAQRSSRFAPQTLREDALLTIGLVGLVVAAVPPLSTGWRSAVAMNLQPGGEAPPAMGLWLTLGLGAVVSVGGLHTLWRRG